MAGQCFGALRGVEGLPNGLLTQLPSIIEEVSDQIGHRLT